MAVVILLTEDGRPQSGQVELQWQTWLEGFEVGIELLEVLDECILSSVSQTISSFYKVSRSRRNRILLYELIQTD